MEIKHVQTNERCFVHEYLMKLIITCITLTYFPNYGSYFLYAHSLPFCIEKANTCIYNTNSQSKWSTIYILSNNLNERILP